MRTLRCVLYGAELARSGRVWRKRRRRSAYAMELARSPAAVGSLLAAIMAVVAIGPGIGVPMIGVVFAATWLSSGQESLQQKLDRAREREALRRARDARETRLEEIGAPRSGLVELTAFVDKLITVDNTAERDLEELLDTYAELTIAAHQIRQRLAETVVPDMVNSEPSLRSAVVRRRIAQVREWRERCEAIELLLAAISARIRTLAQQASPRNS